MAGDATVGLADGTEKSHAFLFSHGKLIDLGTLGGDYSRADGVSDGGWVVGSSGLKGNRSRHAFLYRDGRMRDLGVPGGFESSDAKGVNARGIIVGEASSVTGSGFLRVNVDSHACRYHDGGWTDLNAVVDLSGTEIQSLSTATAINDAGQIVGEGMAKDGWHGVLLTPAAMHGSR